MIEEIKKKRGRPKKIVELIAGDSVSINNKGEVTKVKKNDPAKIGEVQSVDKDILKAAIKVLPRGNTVNVEYKSKKHIINDIIDYIEQHAGIAERSHIVSQASLKKWNTRYYIYKSLVTFFNIDDKTFNGDSLK